MNHPGIDEYDTGSYLEGSLLAFKVIAPVADGYQMDGAPIFEHEEINLAPDLCREHAFDLARTLGFTGPETLRLSYQPGLPLEDEEVLVKRDAAGNLVTVAAYGYGRAYFEPGEPRTQPCAICGVETLLDAS